MIKLDKTKSYYLGDLSDERKSIIKSYLVTNSGNWSIDSKIDCDYVYFHDNLWFQGDKRKEYTYVVNTLELFYTLENVQIDCRDLSEEQIKDMCNIYESNGYEVMKIDNPIKVEEGYVYFQYWDSWKSYWVGCIDKNKHTISYDKFMELFSKEEKPTFCETLKLQPHYDNSNGSLYKICDQLGLNSYEFDIIKRVVRCRKKGQFAEDLKKTKDLIDLYLLENEQSTK